MLIILLRFIKYSSSRARSRVCKLRRYYQEDIGNYLNWLIFLDLHLRQSYLNTQIPNDTPGNPGYYPIHSSIYRGVGYQYPDHLYIWNLASVRPEVLGVLFILYLNLTLGLSACRVITYEAKKEPTRSQLTEELINILRHTTPINSHTSSSRSKYKRYETRDDHCR